MKEKKPYEEVVKRITLRTDVWNEIEKEAKEYKRDPYELVGAILRFHYETLSNE
jgi:hypothetical protein